MDWLDKNTIISLAVGMTILIGGVFYFKRSNPSMIVRVFAGLALLGIGLSCGYYLIYVLDSIENHPLLFGLTIGATGLGINQVAAPVRIALGSAA